MAKSKKVEKPTQTTPIVIQKVIKPTYEKIPTNSGGIIVLEN